MNQKNEETAARLLSNLFAAVTIHNDTPFTLKQAVEQSKTVAKARKEHAVQIALHQQREEEFERLINDQTFRLRVVMTIIEEENVSELVALNRTNTKPKLSQEALKYDLI